MKSAKFYFWLALKMLLSKQSQILSVSGLNALLGLVLGVSCLFVSMAVISGFESTLKNSVADVAGQVQVLYKAGVNLNKEDFLVKVAKVTNEMTAMARFASIEAVIAHQGKLAGISLQGLDPDQVNSTLGLSSRVTQGSFNIKAVESETIAPAVIGLGIAQTYNLNIGDEFRIVLPLKNDIDPGQFRRKVASFKVSGILDLGKYEYNQRMVITDLAIAQNLAEIGNRFSGVLLKFKDIDQARNIASSLRKELGVGFIVRDWHDVNENLFEAVGIEKVVIFFVILIIVIAAAFNVASTLYINVVSRYTEIGLLRSIGVSEKNVAQIFCWQGVLMGAVGVVGGILFGFFLCFSFTWAESRYGLIPGAVYKVDRINLSVRSLDVFAIAFVTLLICLLATLAPALRGAKLSPVEGIKNE